MRRRAAPTGPGPDLCTRVGEVQLANPVMTASGTSGHGTELAPWVDLGRLGAVVVKSLSAEAWAGNPAPRLLALPAGMLNSVGLQGPGVAAWAAEHLPALAAAGATVVVSLWGQSVDGYRQAAGAVAAHLTPTVAAVEANISCPNVERRNQVFACYPDQAAEVVGAVSRLSRLPVFAKLTADVTNIVEVADACVRAGAHGLSLINTLLGMAIDVETFRPKLGAVTGGLSGPAIHPIAVRCVYQVARALPGVPIMGIGGVRSATDAAELLLAGASAVQVGTANFHEPEATIRVADGLAAYLSRHGLSSPAELTGRVRAMPREPDAESDRRGA